MNLITPDKINCHDLDPAGFEAQPYVIDPATGEETILPNLNSPAEELLNSGFDLPPALRKLLKKKIHKQRMEDLRNGKLKKGKQNGQN